MTMLGLYHSGPFLELAERLACPRVHGGTLPQIVRPATPDPCLGNHPWPGTPLSVKSPQWTNYLLALW